MANIVLKIANRQIWVGPKNDRNRPQTVKNGQLSLGLFWSNSQNSLGCLDHKWQNLARNCPQTAQNGQNCPKKGHFLRFSCVFLNRPHMVQYSVTCWHVDLTFSFWFFVWKNSNILSRLPLPHQPRRQWGRLTGLRSLHRHRRPAKGQCWLTRARPVH